MDIYHKLAISRIQNKIVLYVKNEQVFVVNVHLTNSPSINPNYLKVALNVAFKRLRLMEARHIINLNVSGKIMLNRVLFLSMEYIISCNTEILVLV